MGAGSGTVVGGFGDDLLTNSASTGTILAFGNEGNDFISVSNGSHTIFCGLGDDVVFANSTGVIYGGEGYDIILTYIVPTGADTVYGGSDSTAGGGAGGNVDLINTSEGNDLIFGGNGDDTITGGRDVDTQYGGVGADRFVINPNLDDGVAGNSGTTVDFIADLAWGSDIIVSGTDAGAVDTVSAANQAAIDAAATLALAAGIAANDITLGDIGTFTYQGDTYLLQELNTEAFVDADDLLVRITGATGTVTATSVRAQVPPGVP
jgi:Ca2+-binding RTX toxin-like protein